MKKHQKPALKAGKLLAALMAFLMLSAFVSACAPSAEPTSDAQPTPADATPVEPATAFTAGTYTATEQGHNGPVEVSVVMTADAIESIQIVQHAETPGLGETAMESLIEKIVTGQTLAVDAVSGATVSSNALLAAVESCLSAAGGDKSKLTGNAGDAAQTAVDATADIVVVGAGASGLTAAVQAAEQGKSVILLEKMAMAGGNSILSTTSVDAAESAVQKAAGMTETKDDLYAELFGDGMSAEAVRTLVDNSGEAIDWINGLGANFTKISNTFGHGPEDGSGPGIHMIPALLAGAEKNGVDLRLENKAVEILMADGKVSGVKVESPAGNYTITAGAVILCAGGFANNQDMVAQYDARWEGLGCSSSVGQTGDGILMAQAIGADVNGMDLIRVNPSVLYNGEQRFSMSMLRHNGGIMVNKEGKRFANERGNYTDTSTAVVSQTDKCAFMIFDTTMLALDIVKGYYDKGMFASADTIEELAAKLEIDPAGLAATVETYKTYVAQENDPEFGKTNFSVDFTKPEFIGVKIMPAVQGTFGGLKVDVQARVLDTAGAAIPGLYAAGETAGEGTCGTAPLAECLVFGTIAAKTAVADMGA